VKKPKVKNKEKNKKNSLKAKPQPEVVVNEILDTLTDTLKSLLWARWEELAQLELELKEQARVEPDKFMKNLIRSLEHNPCFVEKDGKWGVDKRGQEHNDLIYQWLSTTKTPLTFKELKMMAEENGVEIGEEKDLVWDSRFVRLQSGRWGLSSWKFEILPTMKVLKELLKEIERNGAPMKIDEVNKFLGVNLSSDKLLSTLDDSGLFIFLKPDQVFSKRVLNKLQDKLAVPDPLKLFRQAENNALQEAEMMLIINDNNPGKRQYILSSWDLETGRISLTKRLSKVFRNFPEVCYLPFELNGKTKGVWYFAKHKALYGLKDWFEENRLEPGNILELSWTSGEEIANFTLTVLSEREAEVYCEGNRVLQLASFCREARNEQWNLEDTMFGIMELFPGGLHLDYLKQALALAELDTSQVEVILNAYPFFEEIAPHVWRCNSVMKNSYFEFLSRIKHVEDELEMARREAAGTLAEVLSLQTEKDNLQEELTYLQKVHREEQALYQQKLSELAVQNEHYQLENAKLKSELARLQEHEKELMEEIHAQSEQLVNLRKEKNKLKVRCEQLENKVIQVQGNLVRNLEEAETEIIRLKKQVTEKNSQIESLQYANRELQKNLARLHEERREMKRKLSFWPVRLILSLLGLKDNKGKAVSN